MARGTRFGGLLVTVVPDHPDPSEWQIEAGVTCVACPDCAFTFDAVHIDQNGGYSCPSCAEARQAADLSRLREERDALRARTTRTTPVDWVVFDPEDACCETFGSEDEAVTYASERIAAYRDPDDGWNEDVAALLVAPVAYRARAVNVQHRDDHTEQDWSDMGYEPFDEVCDYELRPPVASSPDPKDGEQ